MAYNSSKDVRPQKGRQEELFKMIKNQEVDFCLIGGSRFGGKVMPFDAEIKTPFGNKTHGCIEEGDIILNPEGYRQSVKKVYPHKDWDFYKIEFEDGSSCEAGLEHLWVAWKGHQPNKTERRLKKGGVYREDQNLFPVRAKVLTTKELMGWLEKGYKTKIPVTKPVIYETQYKIDIDPYLLGYLLGDGCLSQCLSKNILRITRDPSDNEIDKALLELGYKFTTHTEIDVHINHSPEKENILKSLRKLGLAGTYSNTKFLPEKYKFISLEERENLLQGLMDSDGYISKEGKLYYDTTSKVLAQDIKDLVQSLGGLATITSKQGSYKKEGVRTFCKEVYKLYIRLPYEIKPFRLERKLSRLKDRGKRLFRVVKSITFSRTCDGACIGVDNPNRLYLTDDFIVTHNTELISMMDLLFAHDPKYRSIKFRRSYDEIMGANGLWEKGENQYTHFGAIPNKSDKSWTFPSGSKSLYRHMYHEGDEESHRGKGYSAVYFDEINQFTWDQAKMLMTCLRSEADMNSFMVGTLNPDNSSWCMKFVDYYLDKETGFPDIEKCGEIRWYVVKDDEPVFGPDEQFFKDNHPETVNVTFPDGSIRYVPPKRFTFYFFSIFDNEIGLKSNPQYLSELNNLPDHERSTQLYGNWYAKPKGESYFLESFLKKADEVPEGSICVRAWDKAYSDNIKSQPDYTASVKMYKCSKGEYYITGEWDETLHDDFKKGEDVIYGRFRKRVGTRDEWMLLQAQHDGADCTVVIPSESGAGKGEEEQLKKMFLDNGFLVKTAKVGTQAQGKLKKFLTFCSAAENGIVHIVENTFPNKATYNAFIRELEDFTGERSTRTKKDDFVDCVSDCYLTLREHRIIRAYSLPDTTSPTAYTSYRKSIR